jgi:hypothetical protein
MQVVCRFAEKHGIKMYVNVTGEHKPAAREPARSELFARRSGRDGPEK